MIAAVPPSWFMATAGCGAAPTMAEHASKNTPQLQSVASSLRSCLDGMLPDSMRNDPAAFQLHLNQQKLRIQAEKTSWRFGLNYLFETLKQHKEWYARNQQFVQLRKDVKRFDNHVSTIRAILSESVSKLDLEAGLRVAELDGRVGAYKIMFEVTRIVPKLSRPLVKLQILKPSESSLLIYCDTFAMDIVLAGGEGAVESASLMTVEKEQSKQYPERDEDLLQCLKQLAAGESAPFTEKLYRLMNRAELAAKFPDMNFEQLEEEVFAKIAQACGQHKCWTAKRAVDGIRIHFKDDLYCRPISEPPRKKFKGEPAGADSATAASAAAGAAGAEQAAAAAMGADGAVDGAGMAALRLVGYTPLVMVGVPARRLALASLRKPTKATEEEKAFNDFVNWATRDGRRPILPQLHFARDHSVCYVAPPTSNVGMRQEYSLTTKEISGGLQLQSFPIPLSNASAETISSVFQICGHSLLFHSILLSAFGAKNNTFGRRSTVESEDAVNALIKVDVAAPERITLKVGGLFGADKHLLVELSVKADCSLNVSTKLASTLATEDDASRLSESHELTQKLSQACHSIPLLAYYLLQRSLSTQGGQAARAAKASEDCNGIVSLDDELSVSMKIEGEDMLLDDMSMF
ncbi:TPA: hypothetical protein N0F65_004485 [Lagenidium giganteum]|uniref:Mediator of RNA polymerase II transcription subunit 1 n=1 Tax=Lagenidium giganteum TaxID=4803 RepID=A0AAV2ZJS7_9STRA|nr:TPA: hypothetical protein N0F65_004485 [Lagenidium giganteum]